MKKTKLYFIILILLLALLPILSENTNAQNNFYNNIERRLSLFQEYKLHNLKINPPYFLDVLMNIYEKNNFQPFWFNNERLNNSAFQLIEVIKRIEYEGLNPSLYRYDYLSQFFDKDILNANERAVVDILLTNSYFLIASHFSDGLLDSETLNRDWMGIKNEVDLYSFLTKAVTENTVIDTLYFLLPKCENYIQLRNKLKEYKTIQSKGGFVPYTSNRTIEIGMQGQDVLNLKKRLQQSGDFNGDLNEDFGPILKDAVINFQNRHGLKTDGIVGAKTKQALNIGIDEKIEKIIINMERQRWLPQQLGDPYIFVNIAAYQLKVVENGEDLFDMKVIVGQRQRSTPVFSDEVDYIVLNPSWTVPISIAVKDKLPLIKKDINYLPENNYKVLKPGKDGLVEVDYKTIDWQSLNKDNFNYYLRQAPGPNNALGRIKFMFPNKYSVYLHDTPSKELFSEEKRSFSSGCIRLEEPFKLAEYILKKNDKWDKERFDKDLSQSKEQIIHLSNRLPVHIVYMTAWTDNNYQIHFRNDIYYRDQKLIDAYYQKKEVKND